MLRLDNISKSFGKRTIINGFSLELEPGSFFGFMGENGAGKTSLLKIAACLLKPDTGTVYIDNINALKHPYEARNHIGYVPDNFGLYDSLTVEEYMEFYAETYGLSGLKAKYLCLEILTQMHLEDHQNAFVDSLSRGMKQRLCMARAMIHNPDILILDEPFTGIDQELRKEMNAICREMSTEGKIVMFSSHQLSDMEQICNMVGILKNGRLEVCATLDDIEKDRRLIQEIEITVRDQVTALKQFLREEEVVESLSVEGNTIAVRGHFTPESEERLLKKLVLADIPVIHFAKRTNQVEQIFDVVMNDKRRIM